MADTKISGLAALGAAPAVGDLFVLVDISDTSMAPTGTDKKMTVANLLTSPTLTTPVIGVATGTSLAVTGLLKSSGTAGVGYATGAGGTVAQSSSKSTGVTLDKTTGTITMNAAALGAATAVTFTLTNSTIAATDVVGNRRHFVRAENLDSGVVVMKQVVSGANYNVVLDGAYRACQLAFHRFLPSPFSRRNSRRNSSSVCGLPGVLRGSGGRNDGVRAALVVLPPNTLVSAP